MEEDIKKWLKRKLEESSEKEGAIPPKIQVDETRPKEVEKKEISPSPMISIPIETEAKPAEISVQPQPIIPKPEVVKAIEPLPAKEIPVKKPAGKIPGKINKTLLGVVISLGVIIVVLVFFTFNPTVLSFISKTHQYKIFLTHNGKPLDYNNPEMDNGVVNYQIYLSKNSNCLIAGEEPVTAKSEYTFDSNFVIDSKTLEFYEKEGYAFLFSIDTPKWHVEFGEKNATGSTFNYNELPKLSRDFSINFEIPIFNTSPSSYWLKKENGTVQFHAELSDNWQKDNSFYCRTRREYDSTIDGNLPNCPSFGAENEFKSCAVVHVPKCNQTDIVVYTIPAQRNGKNIECNFSLNKLTAGKSYNINIFETEMDGNFAKMFFTRRTTFNATTSFVL